MDWRRTVIFNFAVVERVGVNTISDLLGLRSGTDNLNQVYQYNRNRGLRIHNVYALNKHYLQ
jgi:hypothetical protein